MAKPLIARPPRQGGDPCLLVDHLRSVSRVAMDRILRISWMPKDEAFLKAFESVCLCHDLGKARDIVQKYLYANGSIARSLATAHSPPGAYVKFNAGDLLGAYLIEHHHSGMCGVPGVKPTVKDSSGLEDLVRLAEAWNLGLSHRLHLPTLTGPLTARLTQGMKRVRARIGSYTVLRTLLAVLVYADHLDASGKALEPPIKRRNMIAEPLPRVRAYLETLGDQGTPEIRALRCKVQEAATAPWPADKPFAVLTAGTGLGKTLAAALRACSASDSVTKVIYTTSMLTVTDQVLELFRKSLGINIQPHVSAHKWVPSPLSNTIEDIEPQRDLEASSPETWEHPWTLTTLERLSRVLVGRSTSDVKRMLALTDPSTLVIIDEVQAIPARKLRVYLRILALLGCRVFLMSATTEAARLVLEQEGLPYQDLGTFHPDGMGNKRFRFEEHFADGPAMHHDPKHRKVLAGYNTVLRAVDAWTATNKAHPGSAFLYTARMCHAHRSDILQRVRQRLADPDGEVYLAATQAIWTGTDISFPKGQLQCCPLEGVLQFAGRVNRNGEYGDRAPIQIWWSSDISKPFCPDSNLDTRKPGAYSKATDRTRNALRPRTGQPLNEVDMRLIYEQDASHETEQGLVSDMDKSEDGSLVNCFCQGEGLFVPDKIQQSLTLIPRHGEDVMVFVDYNGAHTRLLEGRMSYKEALRYMVTLHVPPVDSERYLRLKSNIKSRPVNFGKRVQLISFWTGHYHPEVGVEY